MQLVEDNCDDDLEMEYETEEMLLEDKQQLMQAGIANLFTEFWKNGTFYTDRVQ